MHTARWHQAEMSVGLGAILILLILVHLGPAFAAWSGVTAFVAGLMLVVQPPALVRLLEHFRPVPKREFWTVVGGAAAGLVALIVLPFPRPPALLVAIAAYFGGVQGYVGWAVISEARRRVGVTRLRLWLVGVGTSAATVLVLTEAVAWFFGIRPAPVFHLLLSLGTAACYCLGLAPPRRLLRFWQEQEFIRLLRQTAEHAPHEREDHLADDLNGAATRAVTGAATAVLLGQQDLTVYASSESTWEGLRVTPEVGLVGVAFNGTNPVVGAPDECERPLNDRIEGDVVAAIPIARSAPGWGVLVVVHRRASIYQSEDLALLGTLCRHAADVLDHARLIHEERRDPHRTVDAPELVADGRAR